jgi:hypothetical protein
MMHNVPERAYVQPEEGSGFVVPGRMGTDRATSRHPIRVITNAPWLDPTLDWDEPSRIEAHLAAVAVTRTRWRRITRRSQYLSSTATRRRPEIRITLSRVGAPRVSPARCVHTVAEAALRRRRRLRRRDHVPRPPLRGGKNGLQDLVQYRGGIAHRAG